MNKVYEELEEIRYKARTLKDSTDRASADHLARIGILDAKLRKTDNALYDMGRKISTKLEESALETVLE